MSKFPIILDFSDCDKLFVNYIYSKTQKILFDHGCRWIAFNSIQKWDKESPLISISKDRKMTKICESHQDKYIVTEGLSEVLDQLNGPKCIVNQRGVNFEPYLLGRGYSGQFDGDYLEVHHDKTVQPHSGEPEEAITDPMKFLELDCKDEKLSMEAYEFNELVTLKGNIQCDVAFNFDLIPILFRNSVYKDFLRYLESRHFNVRQVPYFPCIIISEWENIKYSTSSELGNSPIEYFNHFERILNLKIKYGGTPEYFSYGGKIYPWSWIY